MAALHKLLALILTIVSAYQTQEDFETSLDSYQRSLEGEPWKCHGCEGDPDKSIFKFHFDKLRPARSFYSCCVYGENRKDCFPHDELCK